MKSNKYTARLFAWFICLVSLLVPPVAQAHAQGKPLQVGLLPIWTTRVLIKNYQPLQAYLEQKLGRKVELVTAPDFKTFHYNTIDGQYDLVITAAHLARLAQTESGHIPLTRYTAPHRTLLLVARDQPLKSIHELKGKVLAGIDPITLAASETTVWLRKQGLHAGVDFTLMETPTPVSAAYALHNHQSVMAISSPQGMKPLPDNIRQDLEIFVSLPELPSLIWIAHPRMASEAPGIKAALLGFTSRSAEGSSFYEMTGYSGMREVSNEDMRKMEELAHEVNKLLKRNK